MREQFHIKNSLHELDFRKVTLDFKEPDIGVDREGGFWTSSYIPEYGSEWLQSYRIYKPYAHVYNGYLLEVKEGSKLLHISSLEDEQHFRKFYKSDYNEVANEFQGLHLEYEYIKNIGTNSSFYFWTCECTWWFDVERLKLKRTFTGEEIKEMVQKGYGIYHDQKI